MTPDRWDEEAREVVCGCRAEGPSGPYEVTMVSQTAALTRRAHAEGYAEGLKQAAVIASLYPFIVAAILREMPGG